MENTRFILFVAIAEFFPLSGQNVNLPQYDFVIEYASKIVYPLGKESSIDGRTLPSNPEEQTELCKSARKFALIDAVHEMGTEDQAGEIHALGYMKYSDSEERSPDVYYPAMWCRAIPQVWLRIGESPNKIIILMMYSRFADETKFTFTPIKLQSRPIPCPETSAECVRVEEQSLLREVSKPTELLHICMNAKKHINEPRKPVLSSYEVVRTIFEFTFPNGEKHRHLAIACPASLPFYVHFGDSESNFKVLYFVES